VDDEWLELARIDVADHVAGTFLEGAPIVAVSAATGSGLHDIRTELDELVARTSPAPDQDRPRLWIDRVFAAKGSGTVVTGTLTGGRLAVNDRVVVGPAGREARIRAIQSLGSAFDSIGPGNRVALNLAGLDHSEVARGHAVTFAAQWRPTKTLDVSLSVLADVAHDVNRRGAYVVYLGSGEHPARLRVLGPDSITAGGQGLVRLHVGTPVPLLPGDRFILRESGRDETIGGGEVLDVAPVRRASRARPDRSVDRVIEEREWVDVDELWALTGERRDPQVGRWVGAPGRLDALQDELRTRVRESGALGLDVAVLDEREREVLKLLDDLRVDGGRIRPVQAKDTLAEHPVVDALRAGGFVPAPPDGVDRGVLRELSRRGVLVERDGVWFHANAIEAAARVAAQLLSESPEGFTVAEFRDAIGASRKHALPLVNELDARGITRRRDDRRIAGPRIPSP
jgi:selenocysteine-specific elongation factor